MTQLQIDAWKKTPLAVNTEPDISNSGNRQVQDLAVRSGCWLRSDSLIMDEPIQIEELAHRPPWLATILEDGANRHYVLSDFADEEQACLNKLPANMLAFVGHDKEVQPTDDYPHQHRGPDRLGLIARALAFMPWILAQATLGSGRKRTTFGVITKSILIRLRPWSRGLVIVCVHPLFGSENAMTRWN